MEKQSNDLQTNKEYDYVIIGGGMVAGNAVKGIREQDKEGNILVLSADRDVPYERPALSKKLWTDEEFTEDEITIGAEEEPAVTFAFETVVSSIDRENHSVHLENGSDVTYKKLLLATGGEPATIDGPEDDHVIAFRSWNDYRKLREFSGKNQHIVIVGGGYIGSELAAALIQNQTKVTLIYPEEILGDKQFPEEIAIEYENAFREAGVELLNDKKAESYDRKEDKLVISLDDGSEVTADTLLIGLGVSPRLSLAEESGLKVDEGVVVNEYLQTSDNTIWAAGDIASYPDPILGRNRIEHVDHARNSGETAGKIMAGSTEPYTHTPYFYSVIFSISWEAIGTLDPSLTLLFDRRDSGKIVYYLDQDRPVGVLLWNVETDLDDVREVLKNPPSDPNDLIGFISEKE